jgi:hypothetical protein
MAASTSPGKRSTTVSNPWRRFPRLLRPLQVRPRPQVSECWTPPKIASTTTCRNARLRCRLRSARRPRPGRLVRHLGVFVYGWSARVRSGFFPASNRAESVALAPHQHETPATADETNQAHVYSWLKIAGTAVGSMPPAATTKPGRQGKTPAAKAAIARQLMPRVYS